MRMTRLAGRSRRRLAQLVVLGLLSAAVALVFGAGSASASSTTVFCAPYGIGIAADVQTAAATNSTVFIKGVCPGTVDLTTSVTLQGVTAGATSGIDATSAPGAPAITQDAGAVVVTLQSLLVTGASNPGDGGGVWDNGQDFACTPTTLNVVSSRVVGNTVTGEDDWGAGINAECNTTLNVTNSLVAGNTTTDLFGDGAGIASDCALAVNVTGSTITGNSAGGYGGGISIPQEGTCGFDPTLSVFASTISRNTSAADGGGIFSFQADVLVQNSTLSANSAAGYGGGIEFGGNQAGAGTLRPQASTAAAAHGPQAPVGRSHPLPAVHPSARLGPLVVPSGLTVASSSVDHNTVQLGAGGGIDAFTNCEGFLPVAITNSSVSFNRTLGNDFDTDSGGGGYSQYSDCGGDTASMVATGSSFIGNLARNSVGGGIFNVSYAGSALVTLATTNVASGPLYLNPNQAMFGGGIFNWDTNSNVTLQPGGNILHNKAFVNGGGVFNDCGATLTVAPGALIMFNTPNQVFTNLGPCIVND